MATSRTTSLLKGASISLGLLALALGLTFLTVLGQDSRFSQASRFTLCRNDAVTFGIMALAAGGALGLRWRALLLHATWLALIGGASCWLWWRGWWYIVAFGLAFSASAWLMPGATWRRVAVQSVCAGVYLGVVYAGSSYAFWERSPLDLAVAHLVFVPKWGRAEQPDPRAFRTSLVTILGCIVAVVTPYVTGLPHPEVPDEILHPPEPCCGPNAVEPRTR